MYKIHEESHLFELFESIFSVFIILCRFYTEINQGKDYE